jgi:molecular chaperone GrpE (heat shock protein)
LEKQKRKEADEKVALAEEACDRLRGRLKELEADFDGFRKANRKAPEAVIRAELARVTGEKAEAEARVERERAEKNEV